MANKWNWEVSLVKVELCSFLCRVSEGNVYFHNLFFSSPEGNHFNVVSIGQLYRYPFRLYSQSPSLKYGRAFLQKKLFMGDKPFGQTYWGLFYMGRRRGGGIMTALCKGSESFTSASSRNLNTINPKVFPSMVE